MTESLLLETFARLDPFQNVAPIYVSPIKITGAMERLAARWIPAEYNVTIKHPQGLGVVYAGERAGKVYGIAYYGTARKPAWHFRFKSMDAVRERAALFFEGLGQHQDLVRSRRKTSYEPHTLKVNDIITNSWGYDQTNVDYRIVKTTRHYVWLQEISAAVEETGNMSGTSTPYIDTSDSDPSKWGFRDIKAEVTKHKASGQNVTMKFGSGSKWDGRKMSCSWYH